MVSVVAVFPEMTPKLRHTLDPATTTLTMMFPLMPGFSVSPVPVVRWDAGLTF